MKKYFLPTSILAVSACTAEGDPPKPEFGHGSERPVCTSVVGEGRTPLGMPAVVTDVGWSQPVKLGEPVNTACPEDAIEIARDGSTLYFMSSPEVNAPFDELLHGTTGVYSARRIGTDPGAFEAPRYFDLRKGTDGSYDGELSFTPSGDRVFFHSTRSDNLGYRQSPPIDDPVDIYVARVIDGEPEAAENLGAPVNSVYPDGEHCLSPDGTRLFLSSSRPGGLGATDIWVSTLNGDSWGEPENIGAPINSEGIDIQPAFAADDPNTMYFTSDRDGAVGIYRSRFDGAAWGAPEQVITGFVGEPTLISDGSLMYFAHVALDDQGVFGSDIWYVTRVP